MPRLTDVTFNGYSLIADAGISPQTYTMPQPLANKKLIAVEGMNGVHDFTPAYGPIKYGTRTVTIFGYVYGDIWERTDLRLAMQAELQGQAKNMVIDTLPEYTFSVFDINIEYTETGSETEFTITCECQPYMSKGKRTFRANAAGGIGIVFASGSIPVTPIFEVPRDTIVEFQGKQYLLSAGTWQIDDILFERGNNEVYINSYMETGTTTYEDMQAFTYKQLQDYRYSDLYWLGDPPQTRATYEDIQARTYDELSTKTYQEWYYFGEASITEEVFVQYDWKDL